MNLDLKQLKKDIESSLLIEDIGSRRRSKEYFVGRAIFYHIARNNSDYTLDTIGAYLNVDHASVVNGLKKIDSYLKIDPRYLQAYRKINPRMYDLDSAPEVKRLNQKIFELETLNEAYKKARLKESHRDFIEILNQIPDYHVETVMMRLKPIVRMLEKPSKHNHLAKYAK